MKKVTLQIEGMHCAGCSNAVDKQLQVLEGVKSASVNFATDTALVEYEGDLALEDFEQAVSKAGYRLIPEASDAKSKADLIEEREEKKLRTAKRNMVWSWAATIPMILWMLPMWLFGFMFLGKAGIGMILLSSFVIAVPGRETMISAFKSSKNLSPNMDVLIAMGTLAALSTGFVTLLNAFGYAPEFQSFAMISGMIMAFHLTGRFIETKAKGSASQAMLKKLLFLEMEAKLKSPCRNLKWATSW